MSLLYQRAVLIYNPAAGRRQARRQLEVERAVAVLEPVVGSIEAASTVGPGSATLLAGEARQKGADLVLACGGDGTVNEVVNGLAESAVPLAVLPAGTANVLALEIGIPVDVVAAARLLPALAPRRVSLGRVCFEGGSKSGRLFLLMSGIGLDAHIVYTLNTRLKSYLGILAYWASSLAQLGRRLETFQVTVEERRFRCTFALASRSRLYGGRLPIAQKAHLLAEDLEVVLFHTRSARRYPIYLGGVATGTLSRFSDVTFLQTGRLEMKPEPGLPVRVEVDGEYAGCLPATVGVLPHALTLLMPPGYIEQHSRRG